MSTPRLRAAAVASAVCASTTFATEARAEGPSAVELTWTAASECPTREAVLAEVANELGPTRATHAAAVVSASPRRDERGRWSSTLVVETGNVRSERRLEAESCNSIATAAALIIAVAIEASSPPIEVSATDTPPSKKAPEVVNHVPVPSPTSDGAPRTSNLLVSASGAFDTGTLPTASPGVEGSVGGSYGSARWRGRIVVAGAYFAPETQAAPSRPSESGTFTLLTLSGRVCGSRVLGAFEVGPCLGAGVESMGADSQGTQTKIPASARWASVVGAAFASWHPTRTFGLSLHIDAIAPVVRPTFVLQEPPTPDVTVHRPGAFSARGAIGVELHFF